MSEINKAVLRGLFEVLNGDDPKRAEELVAPGFVDHAAFPGIDSNGPGGFQRLVEVYRAAFADLQASIEDLIAEDDLVVARYRLTGRQTGEFLGVPASDRPIDIEGVDIVRCESGMAVERWGFANVLQLMDQLGLTEQKA